jgi:chromosomal replication initiation ATPase DnaA
MVNPNIFKPRNDWNIISLRCRKTPDSFVQRLREMIQKETSIDMLSKTRYRGRKYVEARQLFTTFMVRHTKRTLQDIGDMVGRDHATVLHSVKVINNMCDTDSKFKAMYNRIDKSLNN